MVAFNSFQWLWVLSAYYSDLVHVLQWNASLSVDYGEWTQMHKEEEDEEERNMEWNERKKRMKWYQKGIEDKWMWIGDKKKKQLKEATSNPKKRKQWQIYCIHTNMHRMKGRRTLFGGIHQMSQHARTITLRTERTEKKNIYKIIKEWQTGLDTIFILSSFFFLLPFSLHRKNKKIMYYNIFQHSWWLYAVRGTHSTLYFRLRASNIHNQ